MISKNIKRDHILKAIEEINEKEVPNNRQSKKFLLEFNGKHYPPKYLISLANKYINSETLDPELFSGGIESNTFLSNLGFKIINSLNKKVYFESEIRQDLQMAGKSNNYKQIQSTSWIATAVLESNNQFSIRGRLKVLEQVVCLIESDNRIKGKVVIIFPGGFFKTGKNAPRKIYHSVEPGFRKGV